MNTCAKCGADVLPAKIHTTETLVDLDPEPNEDGNIHPIDGKAPYVEVLTGERRRMAAKAKAPLFFAHAVTCPQQEKWGWRRIQPSGRAAEDNVHS